MGKNILLKRLLTPLVLTALTACTNLGPDYVAPEAEWAAEWEPKFYDQLGPQKPSDQIDLDFWWKTFDDETLNELIAIAKNENKTLQIAGLRILESQALLGIANSSTYPQVQTIDGSAAYSSSSIKGNGIDTNVNGANYQAGFNIGWEIDFWGKYRRSIESANASFLSTVADHYDMQVLLSAQVAQVYYQYRTLQKRIHIAKENARIQERSFDISERKFKNGQDSELDLQQAKTQLLSTLAAIPSLELSLFKTRNALSVLLSRPPGEITQITGDLDNLPRIQPEDVSEIPAQYLIRRPDVRSAAYKVAAQTAQIGVAEAAKYPSLSLFGTLGWSGGSLASTQTIQTISGGPAISWNIFDYGRLENNVRVQDVRLQQLIESYHIEVLQAAREIDDSVLGIVKTYERQSILEQTVEAANRALELANFRYREGYADFQRVLEAQRTLYAQSEKEIINHGNHVLAIVELYKALGGGWSTVSADTMLPASTYKQLQERGDWDKLLIAPIPLIIDQTNEQQTLPEESK